MFFVQNVIWEREMSLTLTGDHINLVATGYSCNMGYKRVSD